MPPSSLRPGAASREGEVDAIRPSIERFYSRTLPLILPAPSTAATSAKPEDHFFIGISHRTNEEGARQLATHLTALGYTSSTIDIRSMNTILHLKSGISYIGDNTLVVMEEMAANPQFARFNQIDVSPAESYGANCVRVNDRVLIADGFPHLRAELIARGFKPPGPQYVGVSKNGRWPELPLPALLARTRLSINSQ